MFQPADLVGAWVGTNQLWLTPADPAQESPATAEVILSARGGLMSVYYTWAADGQRQHGLIILGPLDGSNPTKAAWVDSFHTGNEAMSLTTEAESGSMIAVRGSYPAPTGPDWAWRIEVGSGGPDAWTMRMFNITPDGEEALAVLAEFQQSD